MPCINGVVVGKVKSLEDPIGEGRIRVEFPWLGGGKQEYWAPIATLMSGNDRGSWFMPEVEDEVLVAFDQGDIDHPYVIGFMWNGKDKPPETDPSKRLIKSKKGHVILLDDKDKEEKIEVKTGGGLTITMDDVGKSITLKTPKKGHTIVMDESDGQEKIEVKTGGGLTITMDDTGKSITIKASQAITVEASQVTVKAAQSATVESPKVAVQATSIELGEGAIHPAVWGDTLYQYLQELYLSITTHLHSGELAAGIFPVTPMIMAPPPPPVPPMMSTVVKEA